MGRISNLFRFLLLKGRERLSDFFKRFRLHLTRITILFPLWLALKLYSLILGKWRAHRLAAVIARFIEPVIFVETSHGRLGFHAPGEIPIWRARLLLTKEPETIAWIDNFKPGEVLWDIGANVGSFTLYAARRGLSIVALEPSASNYDLLIKNIQLNQLESQVVALCAAAHESTKSGFFFMKSNLPGIAESSFDAPLDAHGDRFEAGHREYVFAYSLSDLTKNPDLLFPNHVKIDVDGNEAHVINGARAVFSDPRMRSVLIELDISREAYCLDVAAEMRKAGLECPDLNPGFSWSKIVRTQNFIFSRLHGESPAKTQGDQTWG